MLMRRLEAELPTYWNRPQYAEQVKLARPSDVLRLWTEEEALGWLWANPSLLPWERQVEWLFSPPVWNRKSKPQWVGDLWGIDERGEVIIIENKLARRGTRCNPWQRFPEHWKHYGGECARTALHRRWEHLFQVELSRESRRRTPDGDGNLPHSCHCEPLRCWPKLLASIDARIRNSQYAQDVNAFLLRRQDDHPPHYCGLIIATTNSPQSAYCFKTASLRAVQAEVGDDHVHVFVGTGRLTVSGKVAISVEQPPLAEALLKARWTSPARDESRVIIEKSSR